MKKIFEKKGVEVLKDALLNKGTAFTEKERHQLNLGGLLPPCVSTAEQQIKRTYLHFAHKRNPLEKYEFLMGLMSRNEQLFYQFLNKYPIETLPIIYTPTVGEAAVQYSRIYFHQRGLYLSYPLKGKLEEIFSNYPIEDVNVIVVTDGERILGLGDQGIGGMTIPIGKLSLYTLFGGIHPSKTLPIILDVGTNNETLLNDDLYLGYRSARLTGVKYDEFIDEFVQTVKKKYPKVLLQWEDFGKTNARRILDKYRDSLLSFNDDIQGTAAVVVAALFATCKIKNEPLGKQRYAILGGGSAGTGIADMIVSAMQAEGISRQEAISKIFIIDRDGLIHSKTEEITEAQKPYVRNDESFKSQPGKISLLEVIKQAKITALIGVCAQSGAFTQTAVQEVAKHCERPIIFPLSNPTTKAECTPDEAIEWTKGKAIVATGSPFPPVIFEQKTYHISQVNNVYIFPGLGLGALASGAKKISDQMILEAARTLALSAPVLQNDQSPLFPAIQDVREVSIQIAKAVAKKAAAENLAEYPESKINERIEKIVWNPQYHSYVDED